MLSKTGIHAALALALMARLKPGEYLGATQIAKEVGAPSNYLGKLLKQLAAMGLLESQKGFGGGFRLAMPASKITLYDVVEPFDKVSKWNGCLLGRKKCSDKSPCAVHGKWASIREGYLEFLKSTTILELAHNEVELVR
jgi:Rrf2 family protein